MKAFLVGLVFLFAVAVLAGIGVLLFPLLVVLDVFIRLAVAGLFVVLCIWLLGKFIIYVWRKFRQHLG